MTTTFSCAVRAPAMANPIRTTTIPVSFRCRAAGDLGDSGAADEIALQRQVADFDWEGVVTVVECGNSASPAGFKWVDIVETSLTRTSGKDTSAAWSDLAQVVLFGGYRGGGVEMFGALTAGNSALVAMPVSTRAELALELVARCRWLNYVWKR